MANPEKSAPEALRDAVGPVLAQAGWAMPHNPFAVPRAVAVDTARLAALRAAHERPGAYGPHPDDSVDALQEDVRDLLLALGLSDHARPTSCHRVVRDEILPEIEDAVREASIARDLLEEHREPGECLTLMVKRLAAEWQRHEAAREALAEAGVECETVAEGIKRVAAWSDHNLNKWLDAEERARKAEAAGGVGLLRRLRAELEASLSRDPEGDWDRAYDGSTKDSLASIDRLIAEAEAHPAEEPTESLDLPEDQPQRGPHVHYTVEPGKRDTQAEKVVTVYGGDGVRVVLGDEPKREPQEGDDVLRDFLSSCEGDVYDVVAITRAVAVLVRRALR